MPIDDFKAAEDAPANLNNLICKCRAVTRPRNVTVGSERGLFSNSLTPMRRVTRWFRRQRLSHICVFSVLFLPYQGVWPSNLWCNSRDATGDRVILEEMKRWVIKSRKGITDPPAQNKEWFILHFQTSGGEPADLTAADEDSPTSPIIAPPCQTRCCGVSRGVRGLKHPPQTPELMDRIWAPIT